VRLGDRTATIVGVLEPSVPYPAETEIIANVVTSPHHLSATMVTGRVHRMTELFGRLAPGADLDRAAKLAGRTSGDSTVAYQLAFARAAETALDLGCPLVCFSATGGARMQESLFSLMQMAKTSAALGRLRAAGLPYISVMTHPTTGGVSASLAMLGDINMAEPEALIGFAGPRVIEQTVRETLPEGFQRSEFLVEHGAIDQICDRRALRERIADLLAMLMNRPRPRDDDEVAA